MKRTIPKAEVDRLITRYLPPGVEVTWRADDRWDLCWTDEDASNNAKGRGTGTGRRMMSTYPDTPFKALVFLHECAHFAIGTYRHELPRHVDEYIAERTAMEWWRCEGHTVPRKYLATAKRYIRSCISEDRKKKITIKRHVAKWAAG